MDLNFKHMKSSIMKSFTKKDDYSCCEIPCGHKKI